MRSHVSRLQRGVLSWRAISRPQRRVLADGILDRFYLGLLIGPNDYRIYRRWDGGYYQVAGGTTETWQVGDIFMLGVMGSANPVTVTLYHNGSAVLSWTSSSQAEVKNGGSPGIGIYSTLGEGITLDNWEGGNLVADAQPPVRREILWRLQ